MSFSHLKTTLLVFLELVFLFFFGGGGGKIEMNPVHKEKTKKKKK